MRVLIVEDDAICSKLLSCILSPYGDCQVAVDGEEAVEVFKSAIEKEQPFDLVCMDIMMPKMDGQEALEKIRDIEKGVGVPPKAAAKVIMTTALGDPHNVVRAMYGGGAAAYIVKPIDRGKLIEEIRLMGLLK